MIITPEGFIRVQLTPEMKERAQIKAVEMGKLRNSIRRGEGNIVGFLGEEAVLSCWKGSVSHNTYQHDLTFDEVSFEVKTKDRTVVPRLHYEASVANYNTTQNADFYTFVSLFRNKATDVYEEAYVIGIMDKHEYFKKARYMKKDFVDMESENKFRVQGTCYNLEYRELTRFESWA